MASGFKYKGEDIEAFISPAPTNWPTPTSNDNYGLLGDFTGFYTSDQLNYCKYIPYDAADNNYDTIQGKWANIPWDPPEYVVKPTGTPPAAFGSTPFPGADIMLSGKYISSSIELTKARLYFAIRLTSNKQLEYCEAHADDDLEAYDILYDRSQWKTVDDSRNVSSIIVHMIGGGGNGAKFSPGGGGGAGGSVSFILSARFTDDSYYLTHCFVIYKNNNPSEPNYTGEVEWYPETIRPFDSDRLEECAIACKRGRDADGDYGGGYGTFYTYSASVNKYALTSEYIAKHVAFLGGYKNQYELNTLVSGSDSSDEPYTNKTTKLISFTPVHNGSQTLTIVNETSSGNASYGYCGAGGNPIFYYKCLQGSRFSYGRGGKGQYRSANGITMDAQIGKEGGVVIQYQ